MVRVLAFLLLPVLLSACVEAHSCTEIGCADAAGVTIKTESGEWAPGVYTLDIAFDGAAHECSFTMPDDLPEVVGQLGELDCDTDLNAYFTPRYTCMEFIDSNGARHQTCTPLERQFDLEVSTYGTPAALTVALELDGSVLVDEAHDLAYQTYYPNGPECGPACRQANVVLTIP
jgi:hypothetical protein